MPQRQEGSVAEAAPQTLEQTFGVEGERTFGSFSCELETEHALFPGRLFVFESAAGFYAHALGHEIAELVPFVRVDDLSKRNLALFLPHAIDISVAGRTLSLCSFSSREEVFELLARRRAAAYRAGSLCARPPGGAAAEPKGNGADGARWGEAAVCRAGGGPALSPERSAPVAVRAPAPTCGLASSPPGGGSALLQRLRLAANAVLVRATEKAGTLTAADDAPACLALLVAVEAVLEHGYAGRARFLGRRAHFWTLLEQLELRGGARGSSVAAARAAGGGGGDAECAHAWLCWGLNRGRLHEDLGALLEGEAGCGLAEGHYAACALLRDELSRSTLLCLLQPLAHVPFQLPLSLRLWPALEPPAPPPGELQGGSADAPAADGRSCADASALAGDGAGGAGGAQGSAPAAEASGGGLEGAADGSREGAAARVAAQAAAPARQGQGARAKPARRRAKPSARPLIREIGEGGADGGDGGGDGGGGECGGARCDGGADGAEGEEEEEGALGSGAAPEWVDAANGAEAAEAVAAVAQAEPGGARARALNGSCGGSGGGSGGGGVCGRSLAEREAEAQGLLQSAAASEEAARSVVLLMSQLNGPGRWTAEREEEGGVLVSARHAEAEAARGAGGDYDGHARAAAEGGGGFWPPAAVPVPASGSAGVLAGAALGFAAAGAAGGAGATPSGRTPERGGPASPHLLSPPGALCRPDAPGAQLCETSPMSAASPGEREPPDGLGALALLRVSSVSLSGAHMVSERGRLATVYTAEAQLGAHTCVAHRRYSHFVALQLELEAAFPRLQLPAVVHELKRGRYAHWTRGWQQHAPLDAPAVEARLRLLQEYVHALLGVRELALSPQLSRFFWPREAEDYVEGPRWQ